MYYDEIKKYLPQYLSITGQEKLFKELEKFPENIDKIYTTSLTHEENFFQGDGITYLLCVHLPDTQIRKAPVMILSNTCDTDLSNNRLMVPRIVYAPIFNLNKYKEVLIREHVETKKKQLQSIEGHIRDIRRQYISHIFYLPKSGKLESDSIVFFDRINNCPADTYVGEEIVNQKIFTLSDYGFYIFLFKLSVHFTRIREEVVRTVH